MANQSAGFLEVIAVFDLAQVNIQFFAKNLNLEF